MLQDLPKLLEYTRRIAVLVGPDQKGSVLEMDNSDEIAASVKLDVPVERCHNNISFSLGSVYHRSADILEIAACHCHGDRPIAVCDDDAVSQRNLLLELGSRLRR